MKHGIKTLNFVLILGLTLAIAGCSRKKEPEGPQDLESVRARLKEQLASGELSKEEAIVRLAQAQAELGSKQEKEDSELSPELEALGSELKEKMAKGEMTDKEATAARLKATGKIESSAKTKESKDPAKEKK